MLLHSIIDADQSLSPDAPTVVLLGSLGSSLAMWEPQIGGLRGVFRLVRIDHRGHGDSPVTTGVPMTTMTDLTSDVLETLDDLGIDSFHVVGLSLGGMIAQSLAALHGGRVLSLAALATGAWMGPADPWLERAATARDAGPVALASAIVERWFTAPFAAAYPTISQRHASMIAATSGEGYAQCAEAISTFDVRECLPRITAPTLVIGGVQDPATPIHKQQEIADGVRQGTADALLVTLDHAAHLLNVEQANAVNALLHAHIAAHHKTGN